MYGSWDVGHPTDRSSPSRVCGRARCPSPALGGRLLRRAAGPRRRRGCLLPGAAGGCLARPVRIPRTRRSSRAVRGVHAPPERTVDLGDQRGEVEEAGFVPPIRPVEPGRTDLAPEGPLRINDVCASGTSLKSPSSSNGVESFARGEAGASIRSWEGQQLRLQVCGDHVHRQPVLRDPDPQGPAAHAVDGIRVARGGQVVYVERQAGGEVDYIFMLVERMFREESGPNATAVGNAEIARCG